MKLKTVLIFAFIISLCQAVQANEREAAKRVVAAFEVKSSEQRAQELVMALQGAGIKSSVSKEVLVSRFKDMLESETFTRDMEDLYIKYFTEKELNEIANMLKKPSLQKFLASRMAILADSQTILAEHLEVVFSEQP